MRNVVPSLALVAVALAPAAAQRNFHDVEIQVSHAAGSAHLFVGAGGNTGVPAEYESWGGGFVDAERWLESVCRSLD